MPIDGALRLIVAFVRDMAWSIKEKSNTKAVKEIVEWSDQIYVVNSGIGEIWYPIRDR